MIAIASVLSPRCYSRARELCDGRLAAIGAKTHRNNAPYESRAPECAVIPPATSGLPVSLPMQHAWNAAAAAWKDLIAALVQIAAPVAAFDRALDPMPECLLLRRRFAYGDGDNSGGTGALHARRLLAALQEIYTNRAEIPSAEIVRLLAADPDAEWCEYRGRTPISQRQLALLLKVYEIYPVVLHPTKRWDDIDWRKQYRTALRLLTGKWQRLGQPFVFENRPGASNNINTEAVMRAPPRSQSTRQTGWLLIGIRVDSLNSRVNLSSN